jgi:hypothetical protein
MSMFGFRQYTYLATLFMMVLLSSFHGDAFSVTKVISYKRIKTHTFASSSSSENEARRLKEEAERIRAEVASFEQEKENVVRKEEEKQKEEQSQKQQVRMRYSAEVPILKEDGSTVVERVDFPPRIKDGSSRIEVYSASLPLGIILGESEEYPGAICVDEVGIGSNGELAGTCTTEKRVFSLLNVVC